MPHTYTIWLSIFFGFLLNGALSWGAQPVVTANPAFFPTASPTPGGIAHVDVGSHGEAPRVYFGARRVMTLKRPESDHYTAVVGLPLDLTPGDHALTMTDVQGTQTEIKFTITAKEYETQHITVKNKQFVNPDPTNLKRIATESQAIQTALKTWRDTAAPTMPFMIPAIGPYSSPFGLRRFFNNEARKPHSGLDIAAPIGTKVLSPSQAVVLNVGNYFFNGKTVFLDHGQGLISMYCHLQSINVKPGQPLKRGAVFGTVGQSGRVTGPHLHWGVFLNHAAVDPLLFLENPAQPVKP